MISTFYEKLKVSLQGDACTIRLLCAFETKSNVLQYEYQVFRSKGIAGWPLVLPLTLAQGTVNSPLLVVHRVPQAEGAVSLGPRLERQL